MSAPGNVVSTATADSSNLIPEPGREANNTATLNLTVEREQPDLIITSFSINPPSPVAGNEQDLISTFTVVVQNRGNSPA